MGGPRDCEHQLAACELRYSGNIIERATKEGEGRTWQCFITLVFATPPLPFAITAAQPDTNDLATVVGYGRVFEDLCCM